MPLALRFLSFSASVDFGLIAPDDLFYGLNTKSGSFDEAIEETMHFAIRGSILTIACTRFSSSVIFVPLSKIGVKRHAMAHHSL